MRLQPQRLKRRGSVLPLVAMCLIALMGMVALAIDIGVIAIARNQCQNAADASSMAGARTITGNSTGNYNVDQVPTNAINAATANSVCGTAIQGNANTNWNDPLLQPTAHPNAWTYVTGWVTVEVGTYAYVYNDANPGSEGFVIQIPRTDASEPYSAVRSTINYTGNFAFGRIFGMTNYNTKAQATAVHRPRDVVIILDLSGSMRFQSLPGVPLFNWDNWGNSGTFAAASWGNLPRVVSMNPDPVYPLFGHYSDTVNAALQGTTSYPAVSGEIVDPCNISSTQNSGPPICADFYANPIGTAPGPSNVAFTYINPTGSSAPPSGDNYLALNGSAGSPPALYGSTVQSITKGKTFRGYTATPFTGYSGGAVPEWSGYTQGPSYWGKTFYMWPPDPRGSTLDANNSANHYNNGAKDWRQRFFIKVNVANGNMGWLDHNTILYNTGGLPATQANTGGPAIINRPSGSTMAGSQIAVTENGASVTYAYKINYAAILYWLFDPSQSANPFPQTLQGGRIRYYSAVPNYKDPNLNSRFWAADLGTSTSGNALTDLNERFWKDYIDFVLGTQASGAGTYSRYQGALPYSSIIGNGDYYQWGQPFQIKDKPDPTDTSAYQTGKSSALYKKGTSVSMSVNSLTDGPLVGDIVTFGADTANLYTVASITAPVSGTATMTLNKALGADVPLNATVNFYPYMDYNDNPYRPKHQLWFGPMTMVDYLGNYNLMTGAQGTSHHWWPGNCHEAHAWACKVGIQTAINDIKNNHPNDFVGMVYFSSPKYSAGGIGHHNLPVVPLGRNYQQLIDSLWFPPTTITGGQTEITPYDANIPEGPRADGGTSPGMGFMLAYNQLSSSTANLRFYSQPSYQLPSATTPNYRGNAGGLGRKGAVRMLIFETDGFPNTRSVSSLSTATNAGLAGSGSDSYFPIRIYNPKDLTDTNNVEWPAGGSYVDSEVYTQVQQIVAASSATPPGFSTANKPMLIHCIGYGSIFDPSFPGQGQTHALTFLQTIQYYGSTSADMNPSNFQSWKQIYGTNAQRISKMQQAFTNIMQSGVQVSLIQ
jgi:hypothetical protein